MEEITIKPKIIIPNIKESIKTLTGNLSTYENPKRKGTLFFEENTLENLLKIGIIEVKKRTTMKPNKKDL